MCQISSKVPKMCTISLASCSYRRRGNKSLNCRIVLTLFGTLLLSFVSSEAQQPLQLPQHERPPHKPGIFVPPQNQYANQNSNQNDRDAVIETKCTYIEGAVNKLYKRFVRRGDPLVFVFPVDRQYFVDAQNTNLRVEMEVDQGTALSEPVLFAVAQRKHINTFELPQVFGRNGAQQTPIYYTAAKTLCIQRKDNQNTDGQNITVRVTTSSRNFISFQLTLHLDSNFQLHLDKKVVLNISPTHPVYLGFQSGRPDLAVLKIRAESDSGSCMTMSVQPPYCPIYDKEMNVKHQGLWQTMTTQSAMTVELVNRFVDGFVVVLVAHDSDVKCSKSGYINPYDPPPGVAGNKTAPSFRIVRNKNVTLVITNESKVGGWIIFLVMGIPVFSTIFLILVVVCLFRNRHNWMRVEAEQNLRMDSGLITSMRKEEPPSSRPNHLNLRTPTDDLVLHDLGVLPSPPEDPECEDYPGERHSLANGERILSPTRVRPPSDYLRTPTERFYQKKVIAGADTGSGGGRIRWKADLTIDDFTQKDPLSMKKSGRRFYSTIIIVAIFYCIPVYQLILHYLRVLYRTGEYDLCYYNYLCAHRLGLLIDFNHFWSNISYMIFGIAFNLLVGRRAHSMSVVESTRKSKRSRKGNEQGGGRRRGYIVEYDDQTHSGYLKRCFGYAKISMRPDHGIPQNMGIFYALGIALGLEGVLSAAYHLCPNQSSFQFDTCFMYVISVLILLKIHQFRHTVHFGANITFLILAAFVLISVIGLMFEFSGDGPRKAYRWTFIAFQFTTMTLLSIYFYSFGYIRTKDNQDFITDIRILGNLGQLKGRPINGDRLILPIISFLLGIAVLVYCTLANIDFATYLLYVLVSNVIGSTFYYVGIMKPLHGEFKNRTWVQPCIYFLGAGIIGGFAVRYFVRSPAAWELSAAASRAGNEDCMTGWFPFYPYYDSHDVWHFLSAGALFLSFMALLIVDDDLITTPQSKIPVF